MRFLDPSNALLLRRLLLRFVALPSEPESLGGQLRVISLVEPLVSLGRRELRLFQELSWQGDLLLGRLVLLARRYKQWDQRLLQGLELKNNSMDESQLFHLSRLRCRQFRDCCHSLVRRAPQRLHHGTTGVVYL